jgi:peptide methionine sulfoxide reductase msrA/msrB
MKAPAKILILAFSVFLGWTGWKGLNALLNTGLAPALQTEKGGSAMSDQSRKTPEDWKKTLTPEAYKVMFQCGTEAPWSGKYNDFWKKGAYLCAACASPLFTSETKYEHGTGWPSFSAPFAEANIEYRDDDSLGLHRVEVRCSVCGAHLGHVFDDGPGPSGRHYCINSAAMMFQAADEKAAALPQVATFAAGCFWGVEYKFGKMPGVLTTTVGYTGGRTKAPTYKQVCTDRTGHAEAVQITFDPSKITYEQLVRKFFELHDPTQVNRQGPDVGTQYRSAIFFADEGQKATAERVKADLEKEHAFDRPIATQFLPAGEFFKAEEYHQKYYQKHDPAACAF